jgi:hypothetical protein
VASESPIDQQVITANGMTATVSSPSVSMRLLKALGVFLKWDAGTHVGVVTIEVSPDRKENHPATMVASDQLVIDAAATWYPLVAAQFTGTIPAVANGVAANTLIIVPTIVGRRARVTYTFTSGTGVLNAWMNGRG